MIQAYLRRQRKSKRDRVKHLETDALQKKGISNTQQTYEMNDCYLQGQTKLSKQIKRVQMHLHHLQSQETIERTQRQNQVVGSQNSGSQDCLPDMDDYIQEEEESSVRYTCVSYEAGIVSKIGDKYTIGGCQFLEKPMSKEFRYFEVTIVCYGQMGNIHVGLAHFGYSLDTMPGSNDDSVAYCCKDGHLLHKKGQKTNMACPVQEGDIIGCGIRVNPTTLDFDSNPIVFFTHNGEEIGSQRVESIPKSGFFPTIGLCSKGEKVQVNLTAHWKPHNDLDISDFRSNGTATKELATKQRKTQDCLSYNEHHKILSYTSQQQRFTSRVGVFQDLGHPLSQHFRYFEVELLDMGMAGQVCIGLADATYPLNTMPGLKSGSVAYHCDDGNVFRGEQSRAHLISTFSPASRGDLIGCGLDGLDNSQYSKVFFTHNHILLGKFEIEVPLGGWYPTIGMLNYGEEVKLNFDAKWPPQILSVSNSTVNYRSNRVHVHEDIIQFCGHSGSIGVYQDVSRPMSREFSYFEVTVKDYGVAGTIGVGLAGHMHRLDCQPGLLKDSVAWHCHDGGLYEEQGSTTKYFTPATEGDVIGCRVDFIKSQKRSALPNQTPEAEKRTEEFVIVFTRNGEHIADAAIRVPTGGLFPTVGMQTEGEIIQIDTSPQENRGATNRSITKYIEKFERVRIREDCVFYMDNEWNDVGGLQLKTNMQDQKYFEVNILSKGDRGTIGIGVAKNHYRLDCQPGWAAGSIAYHCDDGQLHWDGKHKPFSDFSSTNDVIGCGIDESQNAEDATTVFFTRNGIEIGNREQYSCKASDLYPTVCMHSHNEAVKMILTAQRNKDKSFFSRSERVVVSQNNNTAIVQYKPDANNNVGAVQFSSKISEEASYFEITISNLGVDGAIGVGLAPSNYPLDCMPGWLPGSVGYHSDDGCLFQGAGIGQRINEPGGKDTRLGCGVDFKRSTDSTLVVYFTHNEHRLEYESKVKCPKGGLFPTIGLCCEEDTFTYTKCSNRSIPDVSHKLNSGESFSTPKITTTSV